MYDSDDEFDKRHKAMLHKAINRPRLRFCKFCQHKIYVKNKTTTLDENKRNEKMKI